MTIEYVIRHNDEMAKKRVPYHQALRDTALQKEFPINFTRPSKP